MKTDQIKNEIDRITAQRDALLEACKFGEEILCRLESLSGAATWGIREGQFGFCEGDDINARRLRATIAMCEKEG